MSLFLTPQELKELTGRHRRDAQVESLRKMGIEHRLRADGSIAVLHTHIDKIFGGIDEHKVRNKQLEPDWTGVW